MTSQIDMATALELILEPEQEAKFQALKSLQAKKIKYLMSSIDAKDKELAKLKVLGKDNRRTQMIQALRNKLRDQELVSDVIKEELASRNEMNRDEVNAYIMRKTLGGPKRFRPLTREELETRISELEKKLKRAETSSRSGANLQQMNSSSSGMINIPVSRVSRDGGSGSGSTSEDLSAMAILADELQNLRINLDSKEATIEQQKEDISRLRARNSELRISDEELDFQDRNYRELKAAYDQISEDLEEASQKSALHAEESMVLSGELANEKELSRAEIDGLHEQCEKVLRQNSSLLKNMASMENDLEKALHDLTSSGAVMTSKIAVDSAHANAIAAMECKLFRISEKLKICEEKCTELTAENGQINVLKSTLRDRNNSIKDLNRILEEREKNKQLPLENFDDLRQKIVELMRENKTLKQALTAATLGPRQNFEEQTGK